MSRTRNHRRYPDGPRFGHQSRNRYYYGSGHCTGCRACPWFPKRLQREGVRTARVEARETDDAVHVTLTGVDWSWWDDADDDADVMRYREGWWP